MKQYAVMLTESEIELLMGVTEAQHHKAQFEAMRGIRDKAKTKVYTDKLCKLNSKLYQEILKIHEEE